MRACVFGWSKNTGERVSAGRWAVEGERPKQMTDWKELQASVGKSWTVGSNGLRSNRERAAVLDVLNK